MLIYKFTHLPSEKIYLGALKDSARWDGYLSSSKSVKPMIEKFPDDWRREIIENFDDSWRWEEVVYLEQCLIKTVVKIIGWDGVFNKIANTGTASMFAPEVREKIITSLAKPSVRKKMSDSNNAWREANPEAWNANRLKANSTNRSSERRENAKIKSLNYYKTNPDAALKLKSFWANWKVQNPDAVLHRRIKINEILKSPEHRNRAAKQVTKMWQDPEYRASQSIAHIGKHTAEKNGAYKGIIYGVKIEEPTLIIELNGAQEIEKAGFSSKNVYACLSGDRKSHLGYLFTREVLNTTNATAYVVANSKGTRKRKKIN